MHLIVSKVDRLKCGFFREKVIYIRGADVVSVFSIICCFVEEVLGIASGTSAKGSTKPVVESAYKCTNCNIVMRPPTAHIKASSTSASSSYHVWYLP